MIRRFVAAICVAVFLNGCATSGQSKTGGVLLVLGGLFFGAAAIKYPIDVDNRNETRDLVGLPGNEQTNIGAVLLLLGIGLGLCVGGGALVRYGVHQENTSKEVDTWEEEAIKRWKKKRAEMIAEEKAKMTETSSVATSSVTESRGADDL